MKKLITFIFLTFLLSTNAFSKNGKGNVTLSKKAMETFLDYLYGGAKNLNPNTGGGTSNKGQKSNPLLFTLSETGDAFSWNYCPFRACKEPNKHKEYFHAKKYLMDSCFTFASKKIVWKIIEPKGLKLTKELNMEEIMLLNIKDAGYYDGDITFLKGFKQSNNQIKEQIQLPKKL